MIPNTDERLASIVRALTEVVLPHLPPEASLAQEQVQLAVGHLQILRAQLDHIPDYERGELDDSKAIAVALLQEVSGGAQTTIALDALKSAVAAASGQNVRQEHKAIHLAIESLVKAAAADAGDADKVKLSQIILKHEQARVQKDRSWFMPYGFDTTAEAQ